MKQVKSAAALIAGLMLILAIALPAQTAGSKAPEKGCAALNLTPEQASKIAKLKADHQKVMIQLRATLKTKRVELHQLVLEQADQKKLEAKIDEIAKAGADIQKQCLAHKAAVGSLLTDEQKKAMERMHGGMSCGSGRGHGCGSCAHQTCNSGKPGHSAKHGGGESRCSRTDCQK